MIAFVCFSLSHWIFSFKYWVCAQRLVLLLHGENPKKSEACFDRINFAVCTVNIVVQVVWAWLYTYQPDQYTGDDTMLNLFLAFTSLNLLLQLVSLYFLSVALYQIKYQIKNKSVLTINEKGMQYHYLCFIIFLIATLMFYTEDMVAPPPQDITVHTITESFKIVTSVLL